MSKTGATRTTVGDIDPEVLAYTAGRDVDLDRALIEVDCLGTAAHVTMLARMPVRPAILTRTDTKKIIGELAAIVSDARSGRFAIRLADQDVHLAVERRLTRRLGELGKKVHTGRSRNDQVALDLRLYARQELARAVQEAGALAVGLLRFAARYRDVPMVGRTHMQKAMPSSVGLWASAHAESLLDDIVLLIDALELTDQCPLGSAAGYGVPLPIDRQLVSDLLGFARPVHNVLYASNARGKAEGIALNAAGQVMLTLSRLAQDLILYTMPEFGYFRLPASFCTGSSIMPQKSNPDVLELMRARAARVLACAGLVHEILRGAPSGYNRDIQEAKEPFMDGLAITRASLRILVPMIKDTKVDREALLRGFSPEVFATDRALEDVARGVPFRDAYQAIKKDPEGGTPPDPHAALAAKNHLGAPGGLDFDGLRTRAREAVALARDERSAFERMASRLLGVRSFTRLGEGGDP